MIYNRNFDPSYLIEKYKIYSTDHLGDYKFRIIIPIYFEGQLISYQGRDYTNKSDIRYKSCAKKDEIIHYKNIVYGIDNLPDDHGIIVEGIFDKWRMGDNALCTFGTGYTNQQLILLSRRLKKATILFDPEEKAQEIAEKLCRELSGLGVRSRNIKLPENKDPGELKPFEADYLTKKLLNF